MTPKQKQNIAFIAQECLSNVIKHAGATEVEIKISYTPEALFFFVKDNGTGYIGVPGVVTDKSGGRGLKGMRERAEAIDADLIINGDPGKGGTLVSLRIPCGEEIGLP